MTRYPQDRLRGVGEQVVEMCRGLFEHTSPPLTVTLEDFDYSAKPQQRFEVPLEERIAEIRKKKAEDRARSAAKKQRGPAPAASSPYRVSKKRYRGRPS